MGHVIPVLELGKRLLTHHNFTVTIFVVSSHTTTPSPEYSQLLTSFSTTAATSDHLCNIVDVPPANISALVPATAAVVTMIAVTMRETKPALRSAIFAAERRPTVLIVDLFGSDLLDIADELGIPKLVFIASNAWFLSLTVYIPVLDEVVRGEYVDQTKPLGIPGCKPVRPDQVVDPMLDRTDQQYQEYLRIGVQIPKADGVLVNTWEEAEPASLAALRDENLLGRFAKASVYPIGPFTRPVVDSSGPVFDWLDQQPVESVIFVSFGSGGTLSCEQMTEVAWGLELSQQRFVWVVRPPTLATGDAAFFARGTGDDPSGYLPEGFLTRTRDSGRAEILGHRSVGGFWSHCGWNSTLESVTNGVPMIAWPLYAEQKMNAAVVAEELGVGVRPKAAPTKEVVGREEVEKLVRAIMAETLGFGIRSRVKELKISAERALAEGGSSYNALSLVAKGLCEVGRNDGVSVAKSNTIDGGF
ncbi:UDP-glucuronosyl/UDP-glucosyltransferase [Trema orientale]|uniref:UDP-glucuronosyl/UDP-glucosyltransferase n=1 Tax=Trema orientale TaxID=63057 RepID=A0A2P5FXS0_TREOI|nr:UDP-glucuronosyl/UDP-glucosyltransferase [Trema orientale]